MGSYERENRENFKAIAGWKQAHSMMRRILPEWIFGLGLSFSFLAGYRLDTRGYTVRSVPEGAAFLAALLALSAPCTLLCIALEKGAGRLRKKEAVTQGPNPLKRGQGYKEDVKCFLVNLFFIFLIWLPVFLAFYPVIFAYDAEMQMYQVLSGAYSTHHPLIHTLMLGLCYRLGMTAGSVTASMAAYSLFQMAVMAGIFAFTLTWMRKRGMPKGIRIAAFVFYVFFPVNSMLAVSITKDVVFAGLTLLFVDLTADRELFENREEEGNGRRGWKWRPVRDGFYILVTVLMLLFRNNAVYAFAAAALAVCCLRKDRRKRTAAMAGTVIVLFLLCSAGLKTVTAAESGSPREMLSVLFEQMARLSVDRGGDMDPDLKAELDKYMSPDWVWTYDPHLADPIKSQVDLKKDPVGLLKLWIRLGLRYPGEYIDAFLAENEGYWYLGDISYARIYGDQEGSGLGYLSTQRRSMPGGMEIEYHSYIPGLRELFVKLFSDNAFLKVPVISLIFSPAFYAWLLFFYVWMAVKDKRWRLLTPAAFLLGYYLTLLLAPAALMRYMYAIVVCIPALAGLLSLEAGLGLKGVDRSVSIEEER